jgi:ribosomal protein S6
MADKSTGAHLLREYETVFLVKPDLTDDNVDKVKERVRGIVNRDGGKFLRFTTWGKKKTMYPVAKQPRAIYGHAARRSSATPRAPPGPSAARRAPGTRRGARRPCAGSGTSSRRSRSRCWKT